MFSHWLADENHAWHACAALGMGMGMVQSIVSAVLDVVPPLIPPPAWNNMPLPCAPMITGARLWMYLVFVCLCSSTPLGPRP